MASTFDAILGLCPNGLWTVLVLSLLWAALPPAFPQNFSVDDVVAPNVRSHPDDINDSPSSNSKWSPPLSAPSPKFFRAPAAPLNALTAEPMADGEESDSDETVVETEDESANPKSLILRNVRKLSGFFRTAGSRSRSTAQFAFSQLRRGRSLPLDDVSAVSSPLQRWISLLKDDANISERYLAVELARLKDSLKQQEVDNSSLRETVAENDTVIVALRGQLEHRKLQYRKLRDTFRSPDSPQRPSITQRNPLQLDRQSANKQPPDTPTREDYEYEIARLREKVVECNSRLKALISGTRSPGSVGTSPVDSPTESHHPLNLENQEVHAPGMRYSASL